MSMLKGLIKTGELEALQIDQIRRNGSTQMRAQLNDAIIDEYAEAIRNEAIFPPIVVFYDGVDHWLADGFHRVAAHVKAHAGIEPMPPIAADVRPGDQRDATLYAAGANDKHGLRRTNADKRRAVTVLLEDEDWRSEGSGWIAQQCNVSDRFVRKVKEDMGLSRNSSEITVHRGGRTFTMDVSGQREATEQRKRALETTLPDVDEQTTRPRTDAGDALAKSNARVEQWSPETPPLALERTFQQERAISADAPAAHETGGIASISEPDKTLAWAQEAFGFIADMLRLNKFGKHDALSLLMRAPKDVSGLPEGEVNP